MGQQNFDKSATAGSLKKAAVCMAALTVVTIVGESLALLFCKSPLPSEAVWIFLIVAVSFLVLTGFLLLALVSVVRDE